MSIKVYAQHNLEYETSFDEDETKWDIEEAIDKFNDECLPKNDLFLNRLLEELNTLVNSFKILNIIDYYVEMRQSKRSI